MTKTGICEVRNTREFENYRIANGGAEHFKTNTGDSGVLDIICSECGKSVSVEQREAFNELSQK